MTPSDIKNILSGLGIRWNKRYGQHFIINENLITRQVAYAKISPDETVLEIGPGLGALTKVLSEHARKVIAIERDRKLYEYLKPNLRLENIDFVLGDALKVAIPEFDKVVSNLPYNISSEITFKLLGQGFKMGILMYQKEFAERMVAKCGTQDYSRLSVNIYYHANAEIIEYVPRQEFFPQPDVDSAIVRLTPRRSPPFKVNDKMMYFEIVEVLFSHRRKKIRNSLEIWLKKRNMKEKIKIINDCPFSEQRVEELEPEEIGRLCDELGLRMRDN